MTHILAIGDRTYSSWSLRGWLLFDRFGIPVKCRTAKLYTDEFPQLLKEFYPAKLVPAAKLDGMDHVIWDSLALAEALHELHPGAGVWPNDLQHRSLARSLASEMHSGFASLRDECTMNLEYSYTDFVVSDAVKRDLARLEEIWSFALEKSGGPWLCGAYSAADVFYAPVASRIATYKLPVAEPAQAYVMAHLEDGSFRRWRAMGLAENYRQSVYQLDFTHGPWPGPAPLPAKPVEGVSAVNSVCPYSGEAIANDSLAEIDGQIIGFCNQFCRDKSVADAQAWPQLVDILA